MKAKMEAQKEGKPVPEEKKEPQVEEVKEEEPTDPAHKVERALPEPTIDPTPLRTMKP